jgi:NAD(P)H-flavin reductase
MSQHLAALSIGDAINVKGPAGPVQYLSGGFILNQGGAIRVEQISMIAGGTGITPIFQLLRSLLEDDLSSSSDEMVTFRLLFANRSENDILLKSELDDMASRHSDRFQVHYTLSTTPEDWNGETGHVTQQMLSSCLFSPGPASVALLCGPPIMIEHSCVPYLLRLGFAPNQIIEF